MPLIRDPASAPPSTEGRRRSAGCRRSWPPTNPGGQRRSWPLRPRGTGRAGPDADAGGVEVHSKARTWPRAGKASQSSTAHGGDAGPGPRRQQRGPTATAATTQRKRTRPTRVEVDLGGEFPVETVAVYNRTDGDLGRRLDNFHAQGAGRGQADRLREDEAAGPGGEGRLRGRAAAPNGSSAGGENALTSVRGKEADAFKALAKYVRDATTARGRTGAAAHPGRPLPHQEAGRCSTRC